MLHVIRYFKDGVEQGSTPPGNLETMKQIAVAGLSRHGMDCAVITDETGAVVWASVNHMPESSRARADLLASVRRLFGRRSLAG